MVGVVVSRDLLPPQVPPVRRPDLVQPHTLVVLGNDDQRHVLAKLVGLVHGANINDPAPLQVDFLHVRSHR